MSTMANKEGARTETDSALRAELAERKRTEEELRQRQRESEDIRKILSATTTHLELSSVLQEALHGTMGLTGLEGGTICLVNFEHQSLELAASVNTSPDTIADLTRNRIKIGDCLCGQCAKDCQPLILWDNASGSLFATREATRKEGIRFHAAFPLQGRERCIGVLCLFAKSDKQPTQRSLDLVRDLCGPIALAIENTRLFEAANREIAERRRAEENLKRTNRTLRMISQCNQVLVRGTEEDALLRDICHIVVDDGGYRMAWVGLAKADEAKTIEPVAQAGFEAGYLETLGLVWAERERGRGPAGTAIRTGQPCVIQNTLTDPRFASWRAEASQRGYASAIGCPLVENGRAFGVLMIYASAPEAFYATEVQLLTELADNLAFGLVAIRTRAEREQAEAGLRELSRKNEEALRVARMGRWEFDVQSSQFTFNDQYYTLHGTTAAQVGGYRMGVEEFARKYVHPHDAHLVEEAIQKAVASEDPGFEFRTETRILHADGEVRTVLCWFRSEKDARGATVALHGVNQDITERKRAEEGLQRSQALLNESQAIAHLGSWELELATNRLTWSDEVYRIFGLQPQEFGATYEAFLASVHPEDRAAVTAAYSGSVREGKDAYAIEHRVVRKDTGEIRTVQEKCIHVKDETGHIVRSIGMVHDITERKWAEEALARSEQQYRSLFEHMLDGFALCRVIYEAGAPRDYVYLNVNNAFEKLTGLKEVVGKPVSEVIPGIHQANPELLELLGRVGLSGKPARVEVWVAPLRSWFLLSVYSLEREHFAVIFDNITERKRAEEALRESEERHRTILQTAMDGFCRVDLRGRLLEVNEAYCRMSGYEKEALLGMSIPALEAAEAVADMGAHLQKIIAQKEDRFETRHRRKDGSCLPLEVSAQYKAAEGGYIVAFLRDLTEQKRAEAELRRHREHLEELVVARTAELEAANRELEAFSYSVSHDLRAPLRAIDGYAQILVRSCARSLAPAGQEMLERICQQTGRMAQLINDLLAFSRLGRQAMQSEPLDVEALAREAFGEQSVAQPTCTAQITIHPLPPAFGDRAMMRVVLNNLLSNAIKYSRKRNPPLIEVGGSAEGAQNVYFVKDNGAGFDMEQAGRLFGVFQRLHSKEEFEGTGVGLALVQRIIQRHGGRVWAEAKVDQGATFFFSLPARKTGN